MGPHHYRLYLTCAPASEVLRKGEIWPFSRLSARPSWSPASCSFPSAPDLYSHRPLCPSPVALERGSFVKKKGRGRRKEGARGIPLAKQYFRTRLFLKGRSEGIPLGQMSAFPIRIPPTEDRRIIEVINNNLRERGNTFVNMSPSLQTKFGATLQISPLRIW